MGNLYGRRPWGRWLNAVDVGIDLGIECKTSGAVSTVPSKGYEAWRTVTDEVSIDGGGACNATSILDFFEGVLGAVSSSKARATIVEPLWRFSSPVSLRFMVLDDGNTVWRVCSGLLWGISTKTRLD